MAQDIELEGIYRDVEDIVRGTDHYEVHDGYAFRYWRHTDLLSAEEYCFILFMRDLYRQQRASKQRGERSNLHGQLDIAQLYGIHRTTLRRWFKAAEDWEEKNPGRRAPLHYFIRIDPESRGQFFNPQQGRVTRQKLRFIVEMTTMLIPEHQLYVASLTSDERAAALANPAIQDIEDLIAFFGERNLQSEIDPELPPMMQVASFDEKNRMSQPASFDSYPQSTHQLSTGYPQGSVQDASVSLLQDASDEVEEEDHYYNKEDLHIPDLLAAEINDRLWGMFNPRSITGTEIKMRLRIQKPDSFCRTVAGICAEANILAAEATRTVQQVYSRVARDIKLNRNTGMAIRVPSSFFLVELRRELQLPAYPPSMKVPIPQE